VAATRTWNAAQEALPADGTDAKLGAARIRDLKEDLRERLELDHSWDVTSPDDTNDGFHIQTTFLEQSGDPANKTNAIRIYAKEHVTGVTELYWKDSANNAGQLTQSGKLKILSDNNVWADQNSMTPVSLTSASTITPDVNQGNNFEIAALAHNALIANPSNIADGSVITIMIRQDATGGRTLTWGSKWLFPNGLDQNPASGALDYSLVSGIYSSGSSFDVILANIVKDFV